MKKIIFSLALLTGINVNAQLPDGSIAPDFTLTDIDGVSHNLYTYLDQGKTVFIDVSATWCGPCWGFHESGALDDLWAAHGPAGGNGVNANTTDDVIVIFIEGDGTTTDAELHGGTGSQGDWVTGVHHPIIDLASGAEATNFNDDYAIGYFPTIYKICPNRIISEPGQATAAQLYAGVATCPPPAFQSVDVKALSNQGNLSICGPANYTPKVQIQNNGLTNLTDASVSVTYNGVEVSTGTFSGTLETYGVATIICSVIPNFSGGNLSFTVTSSGDADLTNDNLSANVIGAIETNNSILLTVKTDGYASETSWRIKTATGTTVSGTTDPTLANNTTYNFTYTLTNLGCYTYAITDTYGDGILAPGIVNVRDSYGNVILTDENFGEGINVPFKVVHILGQAPTISSNGTITGQTVNVCGTSATLTSSASQGNLWSNGATTRTITVTNPGSYSVTVDGLSSTVYDVVFLTPATVDAGLDVNACEGEMVTLSGSGADSYTWNNGITNGTAFNVTATTTYTVTGTATNGCTDTDVVTITNVTPTVNAGPDLSVCSGSMVTLNGSGADSYTWDNGITNGAAFAVSATTDYTVTGTANGCTDTDVISITKLDLPTVNAGADLDVCEGTMVTLNGSGADSYTWNNGVTNNTAFTASGTQTYTVTGTAINGCTNTDVVSVATHSCASIDENSSSLINVYPNPSNGNVTIKSNELTQFKTVELLDQLGRTLSTWKISSTVMNIELKEVANGNYTLIFKGDNAISTQKIQVNK
ncbi:MAG: T9SS type A sorting domain-containing protein [Bacteroidota bacterium]